MPWDPSFYGIIWGTIFCQHGHRVAAIDFIFVLLQPLSVKHQSELLPREALLDMGVGGVLF